MSRIFLITLLCNILVLLVSRKNHLLDMPEESYQLVPIDQQNYSKYLNNEYFFIFVHNPWCAWSQKTEKILIKINLYLKLEVQPYYIGVIDNTTTNADFIKDINLVDLSYPTILFYKRGQLIEKYNNRLSENELFNWIKKRIYNPIIDLKTEDQVEYKLLKTKRAVIYFPTKEEINYLVNKDNESLDSEEEIKELDANSGLNKFINYSSNLEHCSSIVFFYSSNLNIINKLKVDNSTIGYFKLGNNTDNLEIQSNEEFSSEKMNDFCYKVAHNNLFYKFDEKAIESMFIKKRPGLILFRNKFDNKTEYEEIKLQTISWMNRDLNVIITDIDNKYSFKLTRLLGVKTSDLPSIRLVDFKGKNDQMRNFLFSREVNSENILDFVEKWEAGKLSDYHFYNSPSVKENKASPVMNISVNLFYEKVILNRKNVLVYYYSDWCSHCKKHLPLFNIISKKLNLTLFSLVHINIGQYYDSNIDIRTVPSVVLYQGNKKETPIKLEDKISIKTILSFIQNNTQGVLKDDL